MTTKIPLLTIILFALSALSIITGLKFSFHLLLVFEFLIFGTVFIPFFLWSLGFATAGSILYYLANSLSVQTATLNLLTNKEKPSIQTIELNHRDKYPYLFKYNQIDIVHNNEEYMVEGQLFKTVEKAKEFVDSIKNCLKEID